MPSLIGSRSSRVMSYTGGWFAYLFGYWLSETIGYRLSVREPYGKENKHNSHVPTAESERSERPESRLPTTLFTRRSSLRPQRFPHAFGR